MPRMGPLDESQRTRLVRRTTKIPISLFHTFFPIFFFFVIFLLCSSSGCFISRAKRKIALTTNNLSEEIPQRRRIRDTYLAHVGKLRELLTLLNDAFHFCTLSRARKMRELSARITRTDPFVYSLDEIPTSSSITNNFVSFNAEINPSPSFLSSIIEIHRFSISNASDIQDTLDGRTVR